MHRPATWIAAAILAASFLSTPWIRPAAAVEGAGTFRGSGLVLPHFSNTPNVRTFFRFANAFQRLEEPYQGTTKEGAFVDQDAIFVRLTYLRRSSGTQGDVCEEEAVHFYMAKNDYRLLDVSSDPAARAPKGFQEGYAVAWAVENVAPSPFERGEPGRKVYHNHLAADQVTVDLVAGRAWGSAAPAFRANARLEEDCDPAVHAECDQFSDQGAGWYDERADEQPYAVLGPLNAADPATFDGDAHGEGDPQYESLRYPERFFATVMGSRLNLGSARSEGSRFVILPVSFVIDTDLDRNGVLDEGNCENSSSARPEECQQRSVWVPSSMPASQAYVNRYVFSVRALASDGAVSTAPDRTARCYERWSLDEITAGATSREDFRGPAPSSEEWQGWLDLEGGGFGKLPILDGSGAFDYYNRALVLQIDDLDIGRGVQWAPWPAHDRTTAELSPDPRKLNAHASRTAAATEPNAAPQY